MQVYFNRLAGTLKKSLAPLYLVAGDEPLQRLEACDMIRRRARRDGCAERALFFIERRGDWRAAAEAAAARSLFAERRLIEVRAPDRIDAAGAAFLKDYAADPPPEQTLLVEAAKVDARAAWAKAVAAAGVFVPVYRKTGADMLNWLRERALAAGLKIDAPALARLASRADGDMPAAAQALRKLALARPGETARLEHIDAALGDGGRFSPFDLAEAAAAGDLARATRLFFGLRAENAPAPLVLWALGAQLRQLAELDERARRDGADAALAGVWRAKREPLARALGRTPRPPWRALLASCAAVDEAVKRAGSREAWASLRALTLRVAGLHTPAASA